MSALDDHIRDALNRALDSLRERLESEFGACEQDIVRAAEEAGTRIAAEAAEGATAEARREAEQRLTEVREGAERDAQERQAVAAAEVAELQRTLDEARESGRRQFEVAQHEIEDARREAESAREDVWAARRETESVRQDGESARQDAESAYQQAESARREAESVQQQVESARREAASVELQAESARRELEAARTEGDAAQREVESVRRELEEVRDAIRLAEERLVQAARLPDAIRVLDEATALGEVLDGLVQTAGREAGRAAVFLVKGERLRDWRSVGFDSESGRHDLGLDESGPMAEVVRSGRGVVQRGEIGQPLPLFAGGNGPRYVVARPVAVGGSVVAVLYADGPIADTPNEPQWPAILDVLARHAGRVLESLTVRQAAGLMTSKPLTGGSKPSSTGHQPSGSIQ